MEQREIKFRFWSGTKMHYDAENVIECLRQQLYYNFGHGFGHDHIGLYGSVFMQYTGLKDKNGKEIYEGDIVNSESYNPPYYKIEFIEGGFCCTNSIISGYPIDINHFYPSTGCEIEIIGNVFENPELLK